MICFYDTPFLGINRVSFLISIRSRSGFGKVMQVYLDKSDWLVAKNSSDFLRSDLTETLKKKNQKSKRERSLAPFTFSALALTI